MFSAVELTNFKSFGHIRFDFERKDKEFKHFAAIYGENGSGKSNFVSSIVFLSRSLQTLSDTQRLKALQEHIQNENSHDDVTKVIEMFKKHNNIFFDYQDYRMIGCDTTSYVKYEFIINGIKGYYLIGFTDRIVHEELYYMCSKQRAILFKITQDGSIINPVFNAKTITETNYKSYLLDRISMYWGKHTFLSIVIEELRDKNYAYVSERVTQHLLDVLRQFTNTYLYCRESKNCNTGVISHSKLKFGVLESVTINSKDEKQLKHLRWIEDIIRNFYVSMYSDIVNVYYKAEKQDNISAEQKYNLYFEKIISGAIREIPFSLESAGTQSVLSVMRAILEALDGKTVVYDEIDNGIHDLLMSKILLSAQGDIDGQLIITTHNTMLLENLDASSAYVIYCDDEGNKDARCMNDYNMRVHNTNNLRKMYLNGMFGGIPYTDSLDLSETWNNSVSEDEDD